MAFMLAHTANLSPHPAPVAPLADQKRMRGGCIARALPERACWQMQRCGCVCAWGVRVV